MIPLPPEITFEKRLLPEDDGWSYDFRHRTLGALGRIMGDGKDSCRAFTRARP